MPCIDIAFYLKSRDIIFIFCILMFLMIPHLFPTNSFAQKSLLNITAKIDPRVVNSDQKSIIYVNLQNTNSDLITELDVQLVTPGLEIVDEKKWPNQIYPNSSLIGIYTLKPRESGNHPVYISATYLMNNNSVLASPKQSTAEIKAGEIIVQAAWSLLWLNNNAAITGIIGIVLGASITKISDLMLFKVTQNRERGKKIEKLKGHLLQFLDVNEKRLKRKENTIFYNWYTMSNEGLYHLILDKPFINTKAQNLYVRFEAYNKQIRKFNQNIITQDEKEILDREIKELIQDIANLRKEIESWYLS